MSGTLPHLLFVCVENSCRSQMAEGFARALGAGTVAAFSAGSRPAERVHPLALRLMRERGIDLAGRVPKGLAELPAGVEWDTIVSMGCGDACPSLPARQRVDWQVPDPQPMSEEAFRQVRDRIESLVRALLEETAGRLRPDR